MFGKLGQDTSRDDREDPRSLEQGWLLEGQTSDGQALRFAIGDRQLATTYPGLSLGRSRDLNHLVIPDSGVSRRHFRLLRGDRGLSGEDLNSLNGTLVDGASTQAFTPIPLGQGQTIIMGGASLRISRIG